MKPFAPYLQAISFGLLLCLALARSAYAQDVGWPREFPLNDTRVIVYQPQIESWDDYAIIRLVAAVEVATKGAEKSSFGVMELEALSDVNFQSRLVHLHDAKLKGLRFPHESNDNEARLKSIVQAAIPLIKGKPMDVSLDRILASMRQSPAQQRAVPLSLEAPTIFYYDRPAVLVMFIGKPEFKPIAGTKLMSATNTNWDLFLDPANSRYFLLNEESWLTTTDLEKGVWSVAAQLPADLSKLPRDGNWDDVLENIPGKQGQVPRVVVSNGPAELIVTEGAPTYRPIAGTGLMEVANTDSTLFFHPSESNFYLLVSGRWFRAAKLTGPWSPASQSLPGDFARIPEEHEKGFVLASVPGTVQAKDAVVLASVPQRATVRRADASCVVVYDGTPRFLEVKGTKIQYAINSPNDVLLVDGVYYCCSQGIWFAAAKPDGPWAIASSIPQVIYTIPPEHPKHNVTYVYIYDSTPDVVYVGYTSGYSGEFVATTGVLMFGLGVAVGALIANDMDDDCRHWHVSFHCHSHYYAYGCGAVYRHGYGGYYRSARYYGPYGGAGRSAYFNPSTGAWSRSAYRYGPSGSAFARAGYNPFTDTYAARAGVKTPYGSAGRFYVERDGKSVQGGHRANDDRGVAWAQGSEGGKVVAGGTDDHQGVIAKDRNGNVYVGKDGEIYKRSDDGDWTQRRSDNWAEPRRFSDAERKSAPSTNDVNQPARKNETSDLGDQLQRDFAGREKGSRVETRDTEDRAGISRAEKSSRGSGRRK